MLKKSHYPHNTILCTSGNGMADGAKKSAVRKETCQDWHVVILTNLFVWFYRIKWKNLRTGLHRTTRMTFTCTKMLFLNCSPWKSSLSLSLSDKFSTSSSIKLSVYLFLFLCTYSAPQIFVCNSFFFKFTNWIKLFYGYV